MLVSEKTSVMTKEDNGQTQGNTAENTQQQWQVSVHKHLSPEQISEIITFFTSQVDTEERYLRFRGTFSEEILSPILERRLPQAKLIALARGNDGKIAGVGEMYETEVLYKDPATQGRKRTYAYKLSVTTDSSLYRKGVGKHLSTSLIDQSLSDGVNTFLLATDRSDPASKGLANYILSTVTTERVISIVPDPDTIQYLVTLPLLP